MYRLLLTLGPNFHSQYLQFLKFLSFVTIEFNYDGLRDWIRYHEFSIYRSVTYCLRQLNLAPFPFFRIALSFILN